MYCSDKTKNADRLLGRTAGETAFAFPNNPLTLYHVKFELLLMKRTDFFRKIATAVIALLFCQPATFGQTYRRIAGWRTRRTGESNRF